MLTYSYFILCSAKRELYDRENYHTQKFLYRNNADTFLDIHLNLKKEMLYKKKPVLLNQETRLLIGV